MSLSLPSDSPLLPGVPLGRRVRRLLQAPGTDAGLLADVLRPWIDLLRGATLNSQASILPGGHLDLVPWNVMEPRGVPLRATAQTGLTPFDLEWEYRPPLRLEHVVYRGLVSPLLAARGRSYLNRDATIAELISDLSRRLGAPIDAALLPDLVGREAAIQSVVFGMDQQQVLEKMTAQLSEPSAANTALEIALGVRDARIHDLMLMVAERDARLTQLARERDAAQEQIRAVENSTSWKLTAPLRRRGRS